jgi:hypothetical protein
MGVPRPLFTLSGGAVMSDPEVFRVPMGPCRTPGATARANGMFRALAGILVLSVFATAPAPGQTRIDNPKRPLAKTAGRIVELDEVLRIRDDGKTTIFRGPWNLTLGGDGSLYFLDFAEGPRLYRYGPDGTFIFKTLKDGQGPGECHHPSGLLVTRDALRVLAWVPPKIMDLGFDGRYLREVKVDEDTHGLWFLAFTEGKIYGIRNEVFSSPAFLGGGGGAAAYAIPNSVCEISPDFRQWKKVYEVPVRMAVKRGRSIRLDMIDAAVHGSTMYILHSAEYQVVQLDLHTGRAERLITRAYDRVKGGAAGEPDTDPESRGVENLSSDPYVFDITEIDAVGDRLWVFTSHVKPDGNDQQVDVFDAAGLFIDSFFLRFPAGPRNHRSACRKRLLTDDGYLFVPEQEEDGLVTIGKYKIRGSPDR